MQWVEACKPSQCRAQAAQLQTLNQANCLFRVVQSLHHRYCTGGGNLTITRPIFRGTHNRGPLLFFYNWSVVACGVCCDDTAVSCLLNLCCFSSLFTAQCQQRQPSLHIYSISSNVFFSISEDFCVSSKKSYISSLL